MGGMMRKLLAFLAMVIFAVACGAKKLWGVDVASKEDKGEFESLLAKAYSASSSSEGPNEVMEALSILAGADLSQFSLSEMGTRVVDAMIEVIQDEEWVAQFSEPGVIRKIVQNAGIDAIIGDEAFASPERDDWKELLALEGNPVLYKTKFLELREKAVGKLVGIRMTLADPEQLNKMIRDTLKGIGVDDKSIDELVEIANNPQLLSKQIEELLSDPATVEELTSLFDLLMGGDAMDSFQDMYDEELAQLFQSMQDNPEELEKLYKELFDDPALLEVMKSEKGLPVEL